MRSALFILSLIICVARPSEPFAQISVPGVDNLIPRELKPELPSWDDLRKKGERLVKDTVDTTIKTAFPTNNLILEAAKRTGNPEITSAVTNVQMIGTKLNKETQTAISNALINPDAAIRDAAQSHAKAANDIVEAVNASVRYAERTVKGYGEVLSKAESRAREGDVIGAIWHMNTDKLRKENDNSSALMNESELARQAAETAAASAGGPAGSAAFAAWRVYNQTGGNVEKAMLAGIYSYAVSAGGAKVNEWPSATISQTAKKAGAVASMRGLAVAAAGGSSQDALNAALDGGGSVIVQSANAYVSKKYLEPAKTKAQAKMDAFCMHAVEASCEDAMQWLDEAKESLGRYRSAAKTSPTAVVTADGQWSISWNKESVTSRDSDVPGVVLTYVGQGSPYREIMLQIAALNENPPPRRRVAPPPPLPEKTFNITISAKGKWINALDVGNIVGFSNKIEFHVNNEYIHTHYLHRPLETMNIELAKGSHILTMKARARTREGIRIEGECSVKFTVSGVELFYPYIRFEPVSGFSARVADCALNGE